MKEREMEIVLTATFMLAFTLFTVFANGISITGYAVATTSVDAQTAVQQMLRNIDLQTKDARMCINVRNDAGDLFAFKLRQRGNLMDITQSTPHCEGPNNEDLVITFEDFNALKSFNTNRMIQAAKQGRILLWESRYVRKGGDLICDASFEEKYCQFIQENIPKNKREELGITCCQEEKASGNVFNALFGKFWWIVVIIMIGLTISLAAIAALRNTEEPENIHQELVDYIHTARQQNFGDKEIRTSLIAAGWEEDDVDTAFDEVRRHIIHNMFERFVKIDKLSLFRPKSPDIED